VQGAALPPVDTSAASPEELGVFAEDNLRRAEALLGEGKFFDVIQMLESQVDALPDRSRTRGRLVLAQAFIHNPKWLHRSEEVLKAAIKEEPQSAEAYYLLGTVYKTGGLMNRAASMFRKALEARPNHKQAAEELAALEKAPPPPRRWFRGS
jgi:tetratricopeptide (TPR) repeat protein